MNYLSGPNVFKGLLAKRDRKYKNGGGDVAKEPDILLYFRGRV